MSKSPTNKNSAKGNTGKNSILSNGTLHNKNITTEKEKGNEVTVDKKLSSGKNDVNTNTRNENIKRENDVAEVTEESDKSSSVQAMQTLIGSVDTESVELENGPNNKVVTRERRRDRKKEKKIGERKIDKANERKINERKRERKRERRGLTNSNSFDIGADGNHANKVNFLRGNKFKAVDIHKKLLVVKSDEDLKKLINKENVTEEDIVKFKEELEKTDKTEETKKRNIIIPGVQMCDNYNYISTKFQRPSHYIRYELYRDQVSGIKLNDGTVIHYDMLKEDEVFLQKLNENIKTPVTDDDFSKLIDRFEKATGKWVDGSEEINFKDALEISDELKLNYKSHIVKEIYAYWKKRRKALGKPLLRMLWANCHHNLPNYIVFRPKVKEKMTLRKHKKKNLDTIIKMHKLLEDFRRLEKILKKMRQRDEKKLLLVQLNAILFDQRKNEIVDKTYVCPMWNYFKDYKMEKIYKRFKKDKLYKNVYTNNIINNGVTVVTANNSNNHSSTNVHGENTLDNVRGIKKSLCGLKTDSLFFTYPLNPIQSENVVLIKRRGRNNRIWIDRKIVEENNEAPHKIGLFRAKDASEIIKCFDISEYFPDNFDECESMLNNNEQCIKEVAKKTENEIGIFSAFTTCSTPINAQKLDTKTINSCTDVDELGGEPGGVETIKKGTRKRARERNTKSVEDLKQVESQKKMKLEENTFEKNDVDLKKEESVCFLDISDENPKTLNSVTDGGLNDTSAKLVSASTKKMETHEDHTDTNMLVLDENVRSERETTDFLTNKLSETPKSETNKGVPNMNSGNCSTGSSTVNQMQSTLNLYKKYNRSLFQVDEMMDPMVNRENPLLCLSRYAQEQKKFLFYLENLLNFDNFNFEHKKRRRKGAGRTTARGVDKKGNQEDYREAEDKKGNQEDYKEAEKGVAHDVENEGVKCTRKGTDKEVEKGTGKGTIRVTDRCSSKGANKGALKSYEKSTEKLASASRIKKEPAEGIGTFHSTSNVLSM